MRPNVRTHTSPINIGTEIHRAQSVLDIIISDGNSSHTLLYTRNMKQTKENGPLTREKTELLSETEATSLMNN